MKKGWGFLVFCCIFPALLFLSTAVQAQQGTIVGTVYSSYEIETDDGVGAEPRGLLLDLLEGDVLGALELGLVRRRPSADDVADAREDMGEELVLLDGARVSVAGIIDEIDGDYAITVTSFRELAEEIPEDENLEDEPMEDEYQEEELPEDMEEQ